MPEVFTAEETRKTLSQHLKYCNRGSDCLMCAAARLAASPAAAHVETADRRPGLDGLVDGVEHAAAQIDEAVKELEGPDGEKTKAALKSLTLTTGSSTLRAVLAGIEARARNASLSPAEQLAVANTRLARLTNLHSDLATELNTSAGWRDRRGRSVLNRVVQQLADAWNGRPTPNPRAPLTGA